MSEHDAATPKLMQPNAAKFKNTFRPQPVTTGFAHETGDSKADAQNLSNDACHDVQGDPSQIAQLEKPKQKKGRAAKRVHFSASCRAQVK